MNLLSHVQLFDTPWTVAYQASQPMEFSRQEYWSRLPFPSPGDLPNPGIEPRSSTLQANSLQSEPPGKPPQISISFINSKLKIFSLSQKYNPRTIWTLQWVQMCSIIVFTFNILLLFQIYYKARLIILHSLL